MIYILAILIGFAAGLRAMTPLAAVSWGAYLGWIDISSVPVLSYLGTLIAAVLITVIAIGELITDQLPTTPSRKVPVQFGARIVMGALTGALLMPASWIIGAILGALGAVAGTLLGAELRARLAISAGTRPAAFIEDALAIILAFLVVFLA